MWRNWVNAILGIAVVIFAYLGGAHLWRYVIVGVIIAALSLWMALEKKQGGM